MDNMHSVMLQMEAFGVEFLAKDLPLQVGMQKRKGCGIKGKWWYWLQEFRPDAGGVFVVGRFGSYKTGDSQKVEVDWRPLGDLERARLAAEQAAARKAADEARAREAELAALGALEMWRRASREGSSPYLARKGVVPEACRYFADGTVVIPLIRYDRPRADALRAVQRIRPDGQKFYTKGFVKPGCALRLGELPGLLNVILICEGYCTGLTIRMATGYELVVYVALDAGNLAHVVPLVRGLHPEHRILICADDDWLTRDQQTKKLSNPGRTAARAVAKEVTSCDFVYPVFSSARQKSDTDFNDLHQRQGLSVVTQQIRSVLAAMGRRR